MRALLAVVALLVGCAQSSEPLEPTEAALRLSGMYRGHITGDCFAVYTFTGGRYEGAIECNPGLAHIEHGTYRVAGKLVTLEPQENVCGLLEPYDAGLRLGVGSFALRPSTDADRFTTNDADTDCESDEFAIAMGERQ